MTSTTTRTYFCIDLKSFYASVECIERGLDPFATNLVVADPERTEKTICLAVSPSMRALGVPGRCRVFQIPSSINYIMAPPRMQLYIDYSAEIYSIYLRYVSKDDIHVYSIDEAFLDVTDYLPMYRLSAEELAKRIMDDIVNTTKITAACGIGTNLYLAKIALDITAKHSGGNIGILTEETYQKTLWNHRPLTDFWRIGPGIAKRLEVLGIHTMGEIASADQEALYRLLGVDAELLIDHAWGREPVTIADIKAYKPKANSICHGQVLGCDYSFEDGSLIVKEMADMMALELVDRGLVTDSITLSVGYNHKFETRPAHGTISLPITTSSSRQLIEYSVKLYRRITDPTLPVHRLTLTFNNIVDEAWQQYDLFTDPLLLEKEHKMQAAMLEIKEKFGKNAILKGMNLEKKATARERNQQIGGHRSGS